MCGCVCVGVCVSVCVCDSTLDQTPALQCCFPPGVGLGYRGHGLAGHPLDFAHPCSSDGAEPRHTSSDVSTSQVLSMVLTQY